MKSLLLARVSGFTAAAVVLVAGSGGSVASAAYARPAVTPMSATTVPQQNPRSLGAVSCISESFCLGVGKGAPGPTFSQIWNGSTWQTVRVPSPASSSGYTLNSVSCDSASNCLAVGVISPVASSFPQPLSDAWNGKTWRLLPVLAGQTSSELNGVACPAAGKCIAVGGSGELFAFSALAQLWNGKSWSSQAPVQPAGSVNGVFNGISCGGPDNCVAVGQYTLLQGDTEVNLPLAELWNGTAWTLLSGPAGMNDLSAVSCPTASVCVAVGSGPAQATGSAVWNGTSWTTLTVPGPALDAVLQSVSCTSATNCMAVGGGPHAPLAEQWSGGSSWRTLGVPGPATYSFFPGFQAGAPYSLAGVSCLGPARCLAVGGADPATLSGLASFAVAWNGKSWQVLRTGHVDEVVGVSCSGPSECLTTGGYLGPADVTRTLAQAWDGKTVRLASPSGLDGVLAPVSCPSTTFCLAMHNSGLSAAIWNGKRWTWAATGQNLPANLLSCASSDFCVAGQSGTRNGEIWNGRQWREKPFAAAGNSETSTGINGVSCVRQSFCLATGLAVHHHVDDGIFPIVELWNGRRWRLIQAPPIGEGLGPVSCFSPANCTTTGFYYVDTSRFVASFAARWNGATWQVSNLRSKISSAHAFFGPTSISCPTATSCLAVASYYPGSLADGATDLAWAWNGQAWRRTKTTSPGGLATVSCAAANQCLAVGSPGIRTFAKLWNGRSWRLIKTLNP